MKLIEVIMSRKIILLLFFSIIFLAVNLHAENPKWLNFTYSKSINALEFEGKYLWIGHCGGLTKLNTEDGTMEYFTKANSTLPFTNVTSISIDSTGVKWFGTMFGLTKFDGKKWENFTTNNSPLRSNNILALATDNKGNLWIGTDKEGLTKYDGKNWTFYDTTIRKSWAGIFTIKFDSLGNLYAANSDRNYYGAVNMLDTNYHWKNIAIADYISSISIDNNGHLWFAFGSGYTNGLYKWKDTIIERYFFTTKYLPKGTIGGIDYDSKSNMWLTSYDRGLIKYDGSFNIHGKFIEYNNRYSPIPNLNGQCIKIDKDDNIWMGTNFGLWKFNGKDWISYNPQNSDFDYLKVTTNYVDKYDNVWVNNDNKWTYDNVYSMFIIDSAKWIDIRKLYPWIDFKNIIFDNERNPWFYQNGNLYKYDGKKIELFDTLYRSQNVGNINNIYYDNDSNLWILSSQGTLLKYLNNSWIKLSEIIPNIPDKNINFVKIDSKNNFWIGSNQGLYIVKDNIINNYNTSNGVILNLVEN